MEDGSPRGGQGFRLRRAALGSGAAIGLATLAASLVSTLGLPAADGHLRDVSLTTGFFLDQDRPVLIGLAALLLLLAVPALARLGRLAPAPFPKARETMSVAVLAAAAVAFTSWGTFGFFGRFNLSRDEIQADFDTGIFRTGRLLAAIPAEWREVQQALNPLFMLPVPGQAYWASSYLPGNAALRALVATVADPGWTSPLLVGLAILALHSVSRTLWPDRAGPRVVATVLLVTSPQVLLTGMTSYAMTAHLALNLLWLALFLRRRPWSHAGAIGVGFVATGLHQLVFHPLFALPFVVPLWWERRRRLALVYAAAYAAILVFWTIYWKLALGSVGIASEGTQDVGLLYLVLRVYWLLRDFTLGGAELMLKNGLRFVSWQNVALLPLVALSWRAVRRRDGISGQLAAGVLLTIVAMFVLLPYQGHGWGYRYLHGLVGSFALLAGYGWLAATDAADGEARRRAVGSLAVATAAMILVVLPLRLVQAGSFVEPYRAAYDEIRRSRADVVLVDARYIPFGGDLVRNGPDLTNNPKILDYMSLSEAQLGAICRTYSVATFDNRDAERVGLGPGRWPVPEGSDPWPSVREAVKRLACGTTPTG